MKEIFSRMPRRRSYSSDRHRSSSDDSRYSRRKKKRSRSRSPIKGEYNLKREPDFKRDDSYDEYRRRDSSSSRLTVLNFLLCHSSILNFGFKKLWRVFFCWQIFVTYIVQGGGLVIRPYFWLFIRPLFFFGGSEVAAYKTSLFFEVPKWLSIKPYFFLKAKFAKGLFPDLVVYKT